MQALAAQMKPQLRPVTRPSLDHELLRVGTLATPLGPVSQIGRPAVHRRCRLAVVAAVLVGSAVTSAAFAAIGIVSSPPRAESRIDAPEERSVAPLPAEQPARAEPPRPPVQESSTAQPAPGPNLPPTGDDYAEGVRHGVPARDDKVPTRVRKVPDAKVARDDETSAPPADPGLAALVDRALDSSPNQRSPEAALPEIPDRAEVARTLRELSAEVGRCAEGSSGTAMVRLIVHGPSGTVRHAIVTGDPAGTPAGSCIARMLRDQARFAPFARERFEVHFPYVLPGA